MTTVSKFGGTSMANAAAFRRAADILNAAPERRYAVASAPGKRFSKDEKVTDLLLSCQAKVAAGESFDEAFAQIRARFSEIEEGLSLNAGMSELLDEVYARICSGATRDFVASRGEYLNSKLFAAYLGIPFLDAAEAIFFTLDGRLDEKKTYAVLAKKLKALPRAVIPGFYGAMPDGSIHTFSRGGSDVTGAIVARAIKADLYENWTDVTGMKIADPRLVKNAKTIQTLTYRELRELSYMGATVLHEEAVFPVQKANIPINIRSTLEPADAGTMIVPSANPVAGTITGIAGKKGFSTIYIEKGKMNDEIGFARRVLTTLEKHGVPFMHLPSGIDTISVVVDRADIAGKENELRAELMKNVRPDYIAFYHNLAMVAVVGRGMVQTSGTAARICSALAKAGINIRMIDQGASELNIIVGLHEDDYESAIKAIYSEFLSGSETGGLS